MELYFQKNRNERKIIGAPSNLSEVNALIENYCKERNITTNYTRVWCENNETIFDIGSRAVFFVLNGSIDISKEKFNR